ncbi:hypothetical protein TNCV_37941 [Trichonephila clavipes]|nr:hypothetical protein TNCV_37941 [Trichonephila clavipes]
MDGPPKQCTSGIREDALVVLSLQCRRHEQTFLSSLISSHLGSLPYSNGSQIFPTCTKYCNTQATQNHILDCLGLDKQDLYSSPCSSWRFYK